MTHQELTRAIGCLEPEEEDAICKFIATCEQDRQQGNALLAWRVCRDPQGWICEAYTGLGQRVQGEGATVREACTRFAEALQRVGERMARA